MPVRSTLANLLRQVVPRFAVEAIHRFDAVLDPHAAKSYSQEGEDLLLQRLLEHATTGFYVDVGAHHPQRFSNTWAFYQRGWRGINIEPNPDAVSLFLRSRPRDINVQAGVSDQPGNLTYFQFSDSALNTFDERLARARVGGGTYKILATIPVRVRTLADILAEHLSPQSAITFLSVDAEGFDLQVLRSNDWERFRPKLVLVEVLDTNLARLPQMPAHALLQAKEYEVMAKTLNTAIYRDALTGT